MVSKIEKRILIPKPDDISTCAKIYINAYKIDPWNEAYDVFEIETYISSYLNSDTKVCYALLDGRCRKFI